MDLIGGMEIFSKEAPTTACIGTLGVVIEGPQDEEHLILASDFLAGDPRGSAA